MPRDDLAPSQAAPIAADDLPQHAVRVKGLDKTYRSAGRAPAKRALTGVDLAIPRGSLFGLLGPNGAGKSTLINIFAGLVHKTGGTVALWDTDIDRQPRQARAAIGVVPQELNIDPFFTPRALLEMQAGLYGVPPRERRTDELLATMSLSDKADAYARSLSGGMRRRLMVAKAMVHDPPILVLDEPTAGVDVELRRQLWEHIRALNARGTTILLTTHYLHEAEALCDEIAIIDHGDIVACDTTPNMLRRLDSKTMVLTVQEPLSAVPAPLAAHGGELLDAHRVAIQYRRSTTPAGTLLDAARAAGVTIADISTREAALEDIFLQLTGQPDQPGRAAA